ncbi:TetR/AcrR family transcriptional regulator [Paenibacillus polymyxa]|uniref:TetR/AcrR family transcriptional regulator n=1 Tax=Paenibacillus polymyxa TaxID=1406 RepID=UPI002AB5D7BF|nr:TetR family transcriptional regulator [Paenibacillus polymyxa]MDY8022773.1 TetR family transcriptional regulator [Paenibacillus polymyxa]
MNDVIDLRVVKTLENIKRSFMVCIQKKTFTKITVTDIINEAKINRSTFYKYYKDKYDLRESLIKSTLDELSDNIKLNFLKLQYNNIDTYRNSLVQQLQFMYDHKEWYLTLWNRNTELYVFEDMQRLFEEKMRACVYENGTSSFPKYELFARLFATSAMTTVKWWYECGLQSSVNAVADIIIDNITNGMYRAFL